MKNKTSIPMALRLAALLFAALLAGRCPRRPCC